MHPGVVTGFVKEHKANFQGLMPRELSGEDNKLEYFEAYQKFLSAYDESLEGFLKAEGITREEFEKLCAEVSACVACVMRQGACLSIAHLGLPASMPTGYYEL